jgi:hypothetical protein
MRWGVECRGGKCCRRVKSKGESREKEQERGKQNKKGGKGEDAFHPTPHSHLDPLFSLSQTRTLAFRSQNTRGIVGYR